MSGLHPPGGDMTERVVLLSPAGEPIGTADKHTVHSHKTPYHLAFSCYAFNPDGQLLVTRRALTKRTFPGMWTNSCCGHPAPGEAPHAAVARRLGQELGLQPKDLTLALPAFSYRAEAYGIVEHELCPVFLCRIDTEPRPDPTEVEETAWWSWRQFTDAATAADSPLSPWARLQVPELQASRHLPLYLRPDTSPAPTEDPSRPPPATGRPT